MGSEASPREHIEALVNVFREVRRVLRSDACCFINYGDKAAQSGMGLYGDGESHGTEGVKQTTSPGSVGQVARKDARYRSGEFLQLPWKLALALRDDGWVLHPEVIWHKPAPMPESVSGTRWEQHRVKVLSSARANMASYHASAHEEAPMGVRDGREFADHQKEYAPCPGCARCTPNGGLALRRGSWRPTRSHEYVLMLTKTSDYFSDPDAIREASESAVPRIVQASNFSRDSAVFSKDIWLEKTQVERALDTVLRHSGHHRLTAICVLLASFCLEFMHGNNELRLSSLDSKVGQQSLSYKDGATAARDPFIERATSWSHRWMQGDATAKEFVREMNGLRVHLTNDDKFKEDWRAAFFDRCVVYANSDTPIGIDNASEVGQIEFFHGEHDTPYIDASQAQGGRGGRNSRSVWTIGPEPLRVPHDYTAKVDVSHFAAFPTELPTRCIKVSTSEKGVCPTCGAPWARVIARGALKEHPARTGRSARNVGNYDGSNYSPDGGTLGLVAESQTLGWRPTCICPEAPPVPATVLDCFAGACTTGIAALRLGRDFVGIELSPRYVELGKARLVEDAPMFNMV